MRTIHFVLLALAISFTFAKTKNLQSTTEDPVKSNHKLVQQELKEKFKDMKEGCFPLPKGCRCKIGKDSDGRDKSAIYRKKEECYDQAAGDSKKGRREAIEEAGPSAGYYFQ